MINLVLEKQKTSSDSVLFSDTINFNEYIELEIGFGSNWKRFLHNSVEIYSMDYYYLDWHIEKDNINKKFIEVSKNNRLFWQNYINNESWKWEKTLVNKKNINEYYYIEWNNDLGNYEIWDKKEWNNWIWDKKKLLYITILVFTLFILYKKWIHKNIISKFRKIKK